MERKIQCLPPWKLHICTTISDMTSIILFKNMPISFSSVFFFFFYFFFHWRIFRASQGKREKKLQIFHGRRHWISFSVEEWEIHIWEWRMRLNFGREEKESQTLGWSESWEEHMSFLKLKSNLHCWWNPTVKIKILDLTKDPVWEPLCVCIYMYVAEPFYDILLKILS